MSPLYALLPLLLGLAALGFGGYSLSQRKGTASDDTQIPKLMIGAGVVLLIVAGAMAFAGVGFVPE